MFNCKMNLVLVFLLVFKFHNSFTFAAYNVDNWEINNETILAGNIQKLVIALNKSLDFFIQYYYEMNIDGALGVILAEAQLRQAFQDTHSNKIKATLSLLIYKCQISKTIKQLLPEKLRKHVLFKQFLLSPYVWESSNHFWTKQLEDVGIYRSWTIQDILKNRTAIYNGITSDECMTEILEQTPYNMKFHLCYVSSRCQILMFGKRIDTGYVLTHRLLYVYILRMTGCILDKKVIKGLIRTYCSLILKEAKTNAFLGYPQHDIFLEQVVLCGMEGFTDFFQNEWTTSIIKWQTKEGCYKENKTYVNDGSNTVNSRSANVISFGCTDHASGLGTAALAINLRYVLWKLRL